MLQFRVLGRCCNCDSSFYYGIEAFFTLRPFIPVEILLFVALGGECELIESEIQPKGMVVKII